MTPEQITENHAKVLQLASTQGVLVADVRNVEGTVFAHPENLRLINTEFDPSNGYGAKMSPRMERAILVESQ